MERADVGRAVAEERDRDARLPAELEGERRAGDRREPAADDRVRAEVPALDVVEVHRAAVAVRAALDLPVQLGHDRVRVGPARERVPVRAMGRGEDVAVVERVADADRDRLLADRDMEEARQLAGAEPLLDLLLEAPDQEHLAQEGRAALLGERSFALDLRHAAEFMLSARWRLVGQWQAIEHGLPEGWGERAAAADARATRRCRARRPRCSAPRTRAGAAR